MTSAPVLAAPIDEGKFVLDCDASALAVGCVLQQEQAGELKVVAYASRCLDKAQRNYCTTRRELYGIVFGLRKFRQHLLGRRFTLRTDHAALTYLMRSPEPVGQQCRWLDLMAESDMEICHRAGTAHQNADSLSRRPCVSREGEECRQCDKWSGAARARRVGTRSSVPPITSAAQAGAPDDATGGRPVGALAGAGSVSSAVPQSAPAAVPRPASAAVPMAASAAVPSAVVDNVALPAAGCVDAEHAIASLLEPVSLRLHQEQDPSIGTILKCKLSSDVRPCWSVVAALSDEARTYYAQWDSLVVRDGILYRDFVHADGSRKWLQVIVPAALRMELVRVAHDCPTGGHFGQRRTADQVQRRAYWPSWRQAVERCCRECEVCARVHRGRPPRQGPLQPLDVNGPMDRLHIDLCGPFPRSDGKVYILTCVEAFTLYSYGYCFAE